MMSDCLQLHRVGHLSFKRCTAPTHVTYEIAFYSNNFTCHSHLNGILWCPVWPSWKVTDWAKVFRSGLTKTFSEFHYPELSRTGNLCSLSRTGNLCNYKKYKKSHVFSFRVVLL